MLQKIALKCCHGQKWFFIKYNISFKIHLHQNAVYFARLFLNQPKGILCKTYYWYVCTILFYIFWADIFGKSCNPYVRLGYLVTRTMWANKSSEWNITEVKNITMRSSIHISYFAWARFLSFQITVLEKCKASRKIVYKSNLTKSEL